MKYTPMTKSSLQIARAEYKPKLPIALTGNILVKEGAATQSIAHQDEIHEIFPNTYGLPVLNIESSSKPLESSPISVGVILSGGQAPGGHNVIAGLFDGLKAMNSNSKLYGFLVVHPDWLMVNPLN